MKTHLKFITVCLLICAVLVPALTAFLAPTAFAQAPQKLRVGVFAGAPFVITNGDHYTGYSIDYWEKIAADSGVAFEYVPVTSQEQVVAMLNDGTLDVVIGGVGMLADRETAFDFSHPYFMSGLQILVPQQEQRPLLSIFAPLVGSAVIQVFLFALVFGIIMAHVIYLVEHFGKNPEFQQGYFRDIWEAFWYLLIIVATGEYGDKEARTPIKRLVTVAFWLLGVLFIAQFTAAATSTMTVQQLQGSIHGLNDLPGKRVVTLAGSSAADFLTLNKIPFTAVASLDEAYAQLEQGSADAVVFQAPILQYYASNAGNGKVEVVGPVFAPLPIGFGFKTGNPLIEPVNREILKFYQDGTYGEISTRWFGDGSQ